MDAVRREYRVSAWISRHGEKGYRIQRKRNNERELVDVKIVNTITPSLSSVRYPLQPEKGTHNPPHHHSIWKIKRGQAMSNLEMIEATYPIPQAMCRQFQCYICGKKHMQNGALILVFDTKTESVHYVAVECYQAMQHAEGKTI